MNNDYPRMLYKAGGHEEIHGGYFVTLIVADEAAEKQSLADGWFLTTPEACTANSVNIPADDAKPTRAELEQKAEELGIAFSHRTGDKKLAEKIAAALKD